MSPITRVTLNTMELTRIHFPCQQDRAEFSILQNYSLQFQSIAEKLRKGRTNARCAFLDSNRLYVLDPTTIAREYYLL